MVLFQPLLAPGNQLMGGKLAEFELVRGRDDIGTIKSEQLIPGCRATVNEVLAGRRASGARTYRRRPIVRPLQARQRPRLRSSVR
jgi:hypothetical protein